MREKKIKKSNKVHKNMKIINPSKIMIKNKMNKIYKKIKT